MRTYLRVINPIIAAVVLILCLWAASWNTVEEGKFEPGGVLKGGFQTYFFAKGLFCSSALFILGRVLLVMTEKTEDRTDQAGKK